MRAPHAPVVTGTRAIWQGARVDASAQEPLYPCGFRQVSKAPPALSLEQIGPRHLGNTERSEVGTEGGSEGGSNDPPRGLRWCPWPRARTRVYFSL